MIQVSSSVAVIIGCLLSTIAFAQVDERQIDAWIKELSTKEDLGEVRLGVVVQSILKTDSSRYCETIARLTDEAQRSDTYARIRNKLLRHDLQESGVHCTGETGSLQLLNEALHEAYEIEDERLQFEIHLDLGQHYNGRAHYGLASLHFHMLFDVLKKHRREDFHVPSGAFYDMSFSLYHSHEYEACIKTGLNGLFSLPNPDLLPDDTLNTYQQMLAWNTIGLAYHKTHQPDSAFIAFAQALRIARQINNDFWVGVITGNQGDVYYALGRYDEAYPLLQQDYEESMTHQQFDNAANSLQWIARIDLRQRKPGMALQKLYTARRLLFQMPQPNYLANVYYAFSQVFTSLGEADSVNHYLQRYLHLHDSLETEITRSRTDILQMRLNNLDQIQTIKSLNRQKQQIVSTRNYTIVLVLLLGIVGYMWLNRLRLKAQMRQQEALEGRQRAEAEMHKAREQLEVFRLHLLEKNVIIEKWQTAYESKENSDDQLKTLSDLSHHLILNEDDWLRFKELFDSVYPGFFLSLRNEVPDITQAEQRMAALSKLRLTAREAANLLGISTNTVYTTRRRLRQRLGLDQDSELDSFFNHSV